MPGPRISIRIKAAHASLFLRNMQHMAASPESECQCSFRVEDGSGVNNDAARFDFADHAKAVRQDSFFEGGGAGRP